MVAASFDNECLLLVDYSIQNIHGQVKIVKTPESFPPQMLYRIRYKHRKF